MSVGDEATNGRLSPEPNQPETSAEADSARQLRSASVSESPFSGFTLSLPEAFEHGVDQYDELEFESPDLLQGTLSEFKMAVQRQATPGRIMLRDKLTFLAGVTGCLLNSYWLGWSPSTFYRVYSIEVAALMGVRWIVYRLKRWHYYLLDFCYFANALMLAHLWLLPHSALLHKARLRDRRHSSVSVMFAYATGPLAWSIVAFRNSLVFHSLDKITSLFLHWMPACVVWTLRWYPHRSTRLNFDAKSDEAKARWHHGSLLDLVLLPFLPYLLWAVAYYIKIFVISSQKIQQRGYETLFAFTTANERSLFARIVLAAPKKYQVHRLLLWLPLPAFSKHPLAYMTVHMTGVVMTFLLARVFWESFRAHTLFLLFILCISVWNGAGFYFSVFARRYLAQLEQKAKTASPASLNGSVAPKKVK